MKKTIAYGLLILTSMLSLTAQAASIQPFADYLAWDASESSSSWATVISPLFNSDFTLAQSTNVVQVPLDFHTRSGVRAGIRFVPDNDYLVTKLYWTHYKTGAANTIPIGNHIVTSLFFSGSGFISEDIFFGAYGNWQLVMNMVDAEVSHDFHPLPALILTPKFGIKGGSINQEIDVAWQAVVYTAHENVSNNFTGIGPTFGLGAILNVYPHLNVIGNVSTAIMYGRWNGKDTYHRPAALFDIIPVGTIVTRMNQSKLGSLMMDYYAGLQWEHEGKSHIKVDIGYEMQYWSGQLRWLAVQQFTTLGDLTIQGGTCGVTIDL